MAGNEYQAEKVVANMIVDRGFQSSHGGLLPGIDFAAKLLVLTFEKFCAAEGVDGAMLGRGHEPGTRIIRDARLWPTLESGNECILCEVFRETDVTHHTRETGDEPGRLNSPDGVDGAMNVGGHDPPSIKTSLIRACNRPPVRHANRAEVRLQSYARGGNSSGPNIWRTSVSPSQPGQCCR